MCTHAASADRTSTKISKELIASLSVKESTNHTHHMPTVYY